MPPPAVAEVGRIRRIRLPSTSNSKVRRKPSHRSRYEGFLPNSPTRYSPAVTIRYPLLSPWPEQAIAFTTAIERVARLIARARSGMASHFELTTPGWRMLRAIAGPGPPVTLTGVARRLHVTRPSARETAGRLRDAGYLSIGRSSGDRRARLLDATEAGLESLSELDAALQFLLLEVTNDIAHADLEATARLLNRIATRIGRCETVLRPARRRPAPRRLTPRRPKPA